MQTAKLILEYTRALAWPVVVLVITLSFRKQLIQILERLKKAELPGGVALDFEEGAREAELLSAKIQALPTKHEPKKLTRLPENEVNARMRDLKLEPSPSGLNMDYYRSLAEQDPNIALAGLRIEFDVLTRNVAKGFNVPVQSRDTGTRLLRRLLEAGAIDPTQYALSQQILRLCNAAVHGAPVSQREAESIIASADVLAKQYLDWLSWGFDDASEPNS